MDLKVNGTVKHVLEEQSGQSARGTWRKREFVLETEGEYPKQICMVQWGDAIDTSDVKVGDAITAHIDIASREYNGRWYTDVKAWKVESQAQASVPASQAGSTPADLTPPANLNEAPFPDDNDLPF